MKLLEKKMIFFLRRGDLVNGPVVVYGSASFMDPCEMCSVIKSVLSDYTI